MQSIVAYVMRREPKLSLRNILVDMLLSLLARLCYLNSVRPSVCHTELQLSQRSFSFHGPTVWNSLPSALRDDSLSLNTFSRQLKAYLFGQ